MHGFSRRLLAFALAISAATGAIEPAAAQPAARAITPKVVLQKPMEMVEVAAWVPDSFYLVAGLGEDRELLIVEADTGHIVNRLSVPLPDGKPDDTMILTALSIAADGNSARLTGAVNDEYGKATARAWAVNLQEMTVKPASAEGVAVPPAVEDFVRWSGALAVLHGIGNAVSRAEAEAMVPKLPPSPDGRLTIARTSSGLEIRQVKGGEPVVVGLQTGLIILDGALSPDAARLVLLEDSFDDTATRVGNDLTLFDLSTARFGATIKVTGNYEDVVWLDARRLLVTPVSDFRGRDATSYYAKSPLSPARIIDRVTGGIARTLPPACHVMPLPGGAFVAAGPAACRPDAGKGGGVLRLDPAASAWRPYPGDLGKIDMSGKVDHLAVSADGSRIAVAYSVAEAGDMAASTDIAVFDGATGNAVSDNLMTLAGDGIVNSIAFAPDGRSVFVKSLDIDRFDYMSGEVTELGSMSGAELTTDGRMLVGSSSINPEIDRLDLGTGKAALPLAMAEVAHSGFVPGKPLFWAVSLGGELRLWDTRSWQPVLSTWFFEDQRFLTVAQDGRYDTNLGPDEAPFRWLMADDPWLSLGPQTFMRDYYEPRLTEKLLRCTQAGDCGKVLPPVPPIEGLNRVLPEVEIVSVVPGETPDFAVVTVEVREGLDEGAVNGKTRSGVYDVRLLRDGRVVDQTPSPEPGALPPRTPDEWRKVHRLPGASPQKPARLTFEVPLPTRADAGEISFSAYAYNEDRVKSETARFTFERPVVTPRKPRAYVLTIGVDHYDEARLKLNFASADARLIGERLATVPGHEVRRLSLIGERTPGGGRRVTADMVRAALVALNGAADANDAELKALLDGADLSAFEGPTPDDLVIISFSGHGWASPSGEFYLVPADAKWPLGAALPDTETLISAEELTLWLGFIDARETIFIIDACHSGASVETAGFKPGPMGDPGLGQLAFDKGIRILAAAQGDELAQENPRLGQGLLTYALAAEGIDGEGFGRADLDRDGRILIEEWLRYPTTRLTSLSAEARAGGVAPVPLTRNFAPFNPGTTAPPKVQEPALFDFTGKPSGIALREGKGRAR